MHDRIAYQGITFDDVLLEPAYSDVVPRDTDVRTQLTRNVKINIPIVSSPMDTVTESELAIALAQEGGIGIIHKNLSDRTPNARGGQGQAQRERHHHRPDHAPARTPRSATPGEIMEEHHVSGVPITVGPEKLLKGILTRRDLKFLDDNDQKISEVMTKENLVTAPENTTLDVAEKLLTRNKVEKLLLVDDQFRLKGLITIKDIDKTQKFPNACKDARGRLKVGAAIGVHDLERAASLIEAGVDVLVVDSAHGHSRNVIETVRALKKRHAIDVIAGNVATAEGARALAEAGADCVKAGIGPGSICTTRIVSGVGVPQMSAIANVAKGLQGTGVPLIADGGIRYSGDITKALACGRIHGHDRRVVRRTGREPGATILYRGRSFKQYRGMGSLGAMVAGSADRYQQGERAARRNRRTGSWCPRESKGGCRTRVISRHSCISWSAAFGPAWGIAVARRWRNCEAAPGSSRSRRRRSRRATRMTSLLHRKRRTTAPRKAAASMVCELALLLALAGSPVLAQYPAGQSQPSAGTAMQFQKPAEARTALPGIPAAPASPVDSWTFATTAQVPNKKPDDQKDLTPEQKEKNDRAKYVKLPTDQVVFAFPNDQRLERVILDRLRQDEIEANRNPDNKYPPTVGFPSELPTGGGLPYEAKTSTYPPRAIHYEPLYVVHRRLHFEEKNAERYGWDLGIIQTFVSAAYFYKDVLLWPNSLASGFVSGFWDTNAGKCLPGSPTPYMLYPPGLTITGGVFEGVAHHRSLVHHPVTSRAARPAHDGRARLSLTA